MKQILIVILGVIILTSFIGCGSRDKSKILKEYKYKADVENLNNVLQVKVGSWIKEGASCYGIIILADKNGIPKKVKELQAKVISIQKDKITMKALEDVVLAPVEGCTKLGIKKGETWEETDGDLFQTREESIKFIITNYPDTQIKIK